MPEQEATRRHRPRRWLSLLRWSVRLIMLASVLLMFGLLVFVDVIERNGAGAHTAPLRADAIVVLTGDDHRIETGVTLLARGTARRLLISGVYPGTSQRRLNRVIPGHAKLFGCCIDLDPKARNTVGNADQTREWVMRHGFTSLIVVTSSYHIPRSLVELRRSLPGIRLIPYAVPPRNFHIRQWWRYRRTTRLVLSEYVKFLPASARCVFAQFFAGQSAMGRRLRSCLWPLADR